MLPQALLPPADIRAGFRARLVGERITGCLLRLPDLPLQRPLTLSLKHEFSGYWSRRITEEHRLVYRVTETEVLIAACRYHYDR